MLHQLIDSKKQRWLALPDCPVREVIEYIRKVGQMREPQIAAIETYLFLKSAAGNRPLAELLAEGFFIDENDRSSLNALKISHNAREYLKQNPAALSLYKFARQNNLTQLQQEIEENHQGIDYKQAIKDLFYGISYPDYLMSLPMGAGKTYLMAAIIYLDLYFSETNPNDGFARNFLVLIPNALKSSIGPSLSNIAKFDPTWVLPQPAADKISSNLKFEVLDRIRQSRKTMSISNPNAAKVVQAAQSGFNHTFVVNAEKVILDDYSENESYDLPDFAEKDARRNELRYALSQLPQLGIFVDEVHHVHSSDHKEIKLRKVINQWNRPKDHNIAYMLGFSGTPYLGQKNTVEISQALSYKMKNITNVVYHYPLYDAVAGFLKRPLIEVSCDATRAEIIQAGVEDFSAKFGDKKYKDGTIAKLAIYCPSIAVLEEKVYPLLIGDLNIPEREVLRYHKGNENFKFSVENEKNFLRLDTPESPYRYILLVGIGREGWDCRSLTGVILSQEGDCSKNMVLQTCCRCLREVDRGDEQALIWLNDKNAKYLDEQLRKEQDTNIAALRGIKRDDKAEIESVSRLDYLELGKIEYYQLRIRYQKVEVEQDANTKKKLAALISKLNSREYKRLARRGSTGIGKDGLNVVRQERAYYGKDVPAVFSHWLMQLSKETLGSLKIAELLEHRKQLQQLFAKITHERDGELFWENSYSLTKINHDILLCFHKKRTFEQKELYDNVEIDLLNSDKLKPVASNPAAIYPNKQDTEKVLEYDAKHQRGADLDQIIEEQHLKATEQWLLDKKAGKNSPQPLPESPNQAIQHKDRSFHYIPHNFSDSNYEQEFFKKTLVSAKLQELGVEIYYNGNRHLEGLTIECYAKSGGNDAWHRVGNYTTDFLLITRDKNNKLHKVMLLETKGEGYSHDPQFKDRRSFVDAEFVKYNNQKFGYEKFCFEYFVDTEPLDHSMNRLEERAAEFFAGK